MSTPIRIGRSGGGHSSTGSNGGDEPIGAPSSSLPNLLNSIMSGTSPADYKPPVPNAHDARKDREGHFMVDSQQHPSRPSSSGSASSRMTSNSSTHSLDADLLGATDDSPVAVASNHTATLHAYQPPSHEHSSSTDGLSQFYGLNLPPTPSELNDANQESQKSGYQPTSPHQQHQQQQQQQPSQTSPVQSAQGRRSIPNHKPPPPPVVAEPSPAAPVASIAIDPASAPSGRGSFSATPANGGQLSPKTSKLLRRIKRREEELEELTLENDLLKEANRRANEEKIVREQERRVEARKRAEQDTHREAELNALKAQLADREQVDASAPKHDPFECQRTIDELTELLQLREEQLELINLDRSKLYEEIETWKLGMEKLASLQAHATQAAAQAAQNNTPGPAATGTVLDESPAVFGARSTSEYKTDSSSVALSPLSANSAGSSQPVNAAVAAAAAALSGVIVPPTLSSVSTPSVPAIVVPTTPVVPLNLDPVVEEIWENQHRHPFFGWVPTRYPLRPAFSDESGAVSKPFEEQKLPPGFVWDGAWKLDAGEWLDANSGEEGRTAASTILHAQEATANASSKLATLRSSIGLGSKTPASSPTSSSQPVGTDAEGFRYSLQFKLFAWHSSPGRLDTVRRRRWLRRRIWVGIEATEAMLQNALKAVREIGGVVNPTQLLQPETDAVHASEEDAKEASVDNDSASTSTADKPTLASLAAAYSSGAPGDSFSMFISAPPPEVTKGTADQNPESSAAKALAALLQLGGFGPNAPVVPTTDSSASAAPSEASTPASSPAASASVIANLSSYLASTRVVGLFGRKSVAPPTVSTDAAVAGAPAVTPSPSSADFSLGSAAAPSSVCSFCSNPSHTALQYIDPETYSVVPIASYCNAHYHQCQKHIVLEFQAANPTPLSSTEIKRREALGKDLNPSICCYCDQTETFPVRLLHLKTTSKDDSGDSSLPSVEVLDANDAYRFCSTHMSPFVQLVREFQPITTSPSAADNGAASPSGVTHEEAMKGAPIVTSSSSSPIRPPHDVQAMLEAIENEDIEL